MNKDDLTGKTINDWEVISLDRIHCTPSGKKFNLWKVRCVYCGCNFVRESNRLKKNKICRNCWMKPKGNGGLKKLYLQYKKSSKRLHREFLINEDEFKTITSSNCFYCGRCPTLIRPGGKSKRKSNTKSSWGDYKFNGIDRKDNSKDYIPGNCLSCCHICNRAKNNMGFEEFCEYLDNLSKFRLKKSQFII